MNIKRNTRKEEFMLAQIQAMFAVVDLGKINWNQFLEKYLEIAMSIIGKVHSIILIIAIGFKLIKISIKLLKTTLEKAEIDYGVISFSCSFIRIGLRCIVIFMAVAHIGVEVSSFIAFIRICRCSSRFSITRNTF